MFSILAIGNSFSCDGTHYLHDIALSGNEHIKVFNACIGGCPLDKHYRNMKGDLKNYTLEVNGENTMIPVSLREVLSCNQWDAVTLQQLSHYAPRYETYQPYLNELAAFVRSFQPETKLYLQQTWAYEQGGKRLHEELGYADHKDMYADLEKAYARAALEVNAGIIPSGKIFQSLIAANAGRVHRDGFHASLGLGRYALALGWYETLTGKSCIGLPFANLDVPVDFDMDKVQHIVHETVHG